MTDDVLKILYVEDDEDDYVLIRDFLADISSPRYTLHWAKSYEEGLAALDDSHFDACLLDYYLGEYNGLWFLNQVAKNDSRVPVILLTTATERNIDVEAMQAGAFDFLVKSELQPAVLERSIRYAINRRKTEQKLEASAHLWQTSKDRILLFLRGGRDHHRYLKRWLGAEYELVIADSNEELDSAFDLCILDGPALKEFGQEIEARKWAFFPFHLPFLLVTAREDLHHFTRDKLWQFVDDCLYTPFEEVELRLRVQSLLRIRRLAAEKAAGAFRHSFEYVNNILQTIRQPLLVLDSALRVLSANRFFYETFATTAEATRGLLVYELGNGQWDIPQLRNLLTDILPQRSSIENFEVEHDFPSIGPKTMLLNARRIRPEDDSLADLILLSIEDVTQRRQLENQLHKLNRQLQAKLTELENVNEELSQFVHVASHDLKAPLRAIHNYVDFLGEDLEGSLAGEQREYMAGLRLAVKQGEALINDLLSFSRIGKTGEGIEKIDLAVLMREMKATLEAGEDIEIAVADQWPVIQAEKALFSQVIWNLTSNAAKFNRSHPKRIEWGWQYSQQGAVELWVRDNGIGINPKYHRQIFNIFQRLHTREEFEGTGIGLAIVRKTVKLMGGSVRVESKEGGGSAFFVTLPASSTGS